MIFWKNAQALSDLFKVGIHNAVIVLAALRILAGAGLCACCLLCLCCLLIQVFKHLLQILLL